MTTYALVSATEIAFDAFNNLYVASGTIVHKLDSDGNVAIVAGNGTSAHADGLGTAALFVGLWGIAVDHIHNIVLVSDAEGGRIRQISPSGVVSTIAGNGIHGEIIDGIGTATRFEKPRGIAIDHSGNFLVADTFNHKIRKMALSTEWS